MTFFTPYVIALLLTFNTANGIRCYSCDSEKNPTCKWGGMTSLTFGSHECTSAGFLDGILGAKCFKIIAEQKNGKEYVARGCTNSPTVVCSAMASAIGRMSSAFSSNSESLSYMKCLTCNTDKCNSASKITGFTLMGLLLVAFALLC